LPPEEIVRRILRSVLEHRATDLRDDATVVLVEWRGPTG
jgi:serine phosphatase RsbU (regulator of sigma subunit)